MRLDEAKVILEKNGYELLEEGKLGRALGIGALALGSILGHANAHNYTHNFRDDSVENIIKYKNKMDNLHKNTYDKVILKDAGFIEKFHNILKINPIKSLKKINIPDNVSDITFYSYGDEDGYSITLYYDNGTSKHITYVAYPDPWSKSKIETVDEYDNVINRKYISSSKAKNIIDNFYKNLMSEFKKDFNINSYNEEINDTEINKSQKKDINILDRLTKLSKLDKTHSSEEEPEDYSTEEYKKYKKKQLDNKEKIINKYSYKNVDNEELDDKEEKINRIMAKYQK